MINDMLNNKQVFLENFYEFFSKKELMKPFLPEEEKNTLEPICSPEFLQTLSEQISLWILGESKYRLCVLTTQGLESSVSFFMYPSGIYSATQIEISRIHDYKLASFIQNERAKLEGEI